MEIFYIQADRWMTGGATRGQGEEIITKIERKVNDRRERGIGLQLHTTVNRSAVAEREREEAEVQQTRETGDIKQAKKTDKESMMKGSKEW